MNRFPLLCLAVLGPALLLGQPLTLSIEKTVTPPQFTKGDYLGDIRYDPNGHTILNYVEEQPLYNNFKTYTFDQNFELVDHKVEEIKALEAVNSAWKDLLDVDHYRGDNYVVEGVSIKPGAGGKLIARKKRTTWKFSAVLGDYYPSVELLDRQPLKGVDDDRWYTYYRAENYQTGEALVLVGHKAEKGSKIKNQHTRHFQLLMVSPDLEVRFKEEIQFDYAMCISYARVIEASNLPPSLVDDPIGDLAQGDLALVFSPMKTVLTDKTTNPNPGSYLLVIVGKDGTIKAKQPLGVPASGWWIEDMKKFETGEIVAYGPAKSGPYLNEVRPVNSPLTNGSEVNAEVRWNDFQLLRLRPDLTVQYFSITDLPEFKDKLATPPSQRQQPTYLGKRFETSQVMLTPKGDLLIAGQKFLNSNVTTQAGKNGSILNPNIRLYGDLLIFHFDSEGELKRQYGVRRDRMNLAARSDLTPIDLYLGKDPNTVYWVYGEIQGNRPAWDVDSDLANSATAVKAKLLYYPTVAKINLEDGAVTDFTPFGVDESGQQRYYTHPHIPQFYVPGSHLTFIGEDKAGQSVWFGRLELE